MAKMKEKDHFHTFCIYRNMAISHNNCTNASPMEMVIATQNNFF